MSLAGPKNKADQDLVNRLGILLFKDRSESYTRETVVIEGNESENFNGEVTIGDIIDFFSGQEDRTPKNKSMQGGVDYSRWEGGL